MATPTKTIQTALLALQSVASGAIVISTVLDVSTAFEAALGIRFGRRAATALTVPCYFRIEASFVASGDTNWIPLFTVASDTAAVEAEAATGTNNAGQAVVTVAATANLADGDFVFIDNTTIANSEWKRIKSIVTNTSVTFEENLANAQSAGAATLYDGANAWALVVPVLSVKRLRVVVDNSGTGQAIAVEVTAITADSIG